MGLTSQLNSKYKRQINDGKFPICYLCGQRITRIQDVTQDHILPKALGGQTVPANLVVSHKDCNNKKGSLTVQEWFDRQRE